MLFSLGDLQEEPNNHTLVVQKAVRFAVAGLNRRTDDADATLLSRVRSGGSSLRTCIIVATAPVVAFFLYGVEPFYVQNGVDPFHLRRVHL